MNWGSIFDWSGRVSAVAGVIATLLGAQSGPWGILVGLLGYEAANLHNYIQEKNLNSK